MDFERGSEFIQKEEPKGDRGYSEKERAKAIEGSTQDVKQIGNKRKPIPSTSSRRKRDADRR